MKKHRVRGDARIPKNLLTFLNSEIGVQIANIRVPIYITSNQLIWNNQFGEKPAG